MLIKDVNCRLNDDMSAPAMSVESRNATDIELALFKGFFETRYELSKPYSKAVELKLSKLFDALDSQSALSLLTKNLYTLKNGAKLISYEFAPGSETPAFITGLEGDDYYGGNLIHKGCVGFFVFGDYLDSKKDLDHNSAYDGGNIYHKVRDLITEEVPEDLMKTTEDYIKTNLGCESILVELHVHDHVL